MRLLVQRDFMAARIFCALEGPAPGGSSMPNLHRARWRPAGRWRTLAADGAEGHRIDVGAPKGAIAPRAGGRVGSTPLIRQ
jgi:hypothetical protein